jgi:carboxyl-terminal processing protease
MTKSSLLIAGALAAGVAAGSIIAAVSGESRSGVSAQDLALIGAVIQLVQRDYVHQVGSDELTKDALKGMLSRLDPHSDYMDEQEYKQSLGSISGRFGGVGMELSEQDGLPKVIAPIDGSPAARAGVQPGDVIVGIDGKSTQGLSLVEIVGVLRGKPGTTVKLTISRGTNEPFDTTLTRSIIHVQSVKTKLEPSGIGYVRVVEFSDEAARDVKQAIGTLKQEAGGKLKGFVLDLRDDPGGLLTSAVAIAGDFLDGGTVVSIRGRHRGAEQSFTAPANGDILAGTPTVVLINGASASASEIVAGALQDRHRATVMGTRSFGKGSVQTIIPLNGHGALRLTTALYYTPGGRSIQGEGIAPDIVVEATKDEQVAGAVMLRESELRGAFSNPGSLTPNGSGGNGEKPPAADKKVVASPPIKADLIGAPEDSQLKEALSYLERTVGTK